MTETNPTRTRKLLLSMVGGAIVGALAAGFGMDMLTAELGDRADPSRLIAATLGGAYELMAIGVGAGVLVPALGAHFLNAEDAEELREQREMLIPAALAMALSGAAILLLAFAEPPMAGNPAGFGAIVLLAGGAVAAWQSHRVSDELFAQVNAEAAAFGYHAIVLVGGGGALAAYLGAVPAWAPLDWISLFYAVGLISAFVVAGRRGMLRLG